MPCLSNGPLSIGRESPNAGVKSQSSLEADVSGGSLCVAETQSRATGSSEASSFYEALVMDTQSDTDIIDILINAGLLGDFGDRFDTLPLVDLWLDLSQNIEEDDISLPSELIAERDAVVR